MFATERGRIVAVKLSPGDDKDTLSSKVLWETRAAQEDRLASPVIHEGLLFSVTGNGILDAVDVATGKIVKRKRLDLGEGRVDASLSLASDLLYVQSTNGVTVILKPTAACQEIARNEADGSSSSPFFVDERVLVRTPTHMVCIRASGMEALSERR